MTASLGSLGGAKHKQSRFIRPDGACQPHKQPRDVRFGSCHYCERCANDSAAGRTDVYEKNKPAPHGHRRKTIREGTMVVRAKMVESHTLKFGMDRILSEDLSSTNTRLEVPCMSAPPCAGCISSLYRCCRTSPTIADTNLYRGIHAPQPLRPYTNGETNLHQNGQNGTGINPKRKRSWSRAVFSNLQRKGLEKRFQLQKYITKPDRRQLAATLGLTDAQVKVWFQNRRMKWRHTKESSRPPMKEASENILVSADSTQSQNADSDCEAEIDVQTVD